MKMHTCSYCKWRDLFECLDSNHKNFYLASASKISDLIFLYTFFIISTFRGLVSKTGISKGW